MKKLLLLGLAGALCTTALADNPKSVRKELTADYARFSKMFKANDVDGMAPYLTDDYIVVQPNGLSATKAQVLQEFKAISSQLHVTKWDRTIKSLTLQGNKAIVVVDGSFSGDVTNPKNHSKHTMTQTATTKDTWVKTAKGYRLQKSEVQKNTMLLDGKPMPNGR